MDEKKIAKRAKEIFVNGVCCSEAIVYAVAEEYDPDFAPKYMKMASGLCGGVGVGDLCGIITGGACAIGIVLGRESLSEPQKIKCSLISQNMAKRFKAEFELMNCNELKLSTPPNYGGVRNYCTYMVERGTEITVEIINEHL